MSRGNGAKEGLWGERATIWRTTGEEVGGSLRQPPAAATGAGAAGNPPQPPSGITSAHETLTAERCFCATDSKAHLPPARDDVSLSRSHSVRVRHTRPSPASPAGDKDDSDRAVSNTREEKERLGEKEKEKENPYVAQARPGAIPQLYDIPLGMVNRVVYGPPRRRRRRAP